MYIFSLFYLRIAMYLLFKPKQINSKYRSFHFLLKDTTRKNYVTKQEYFLNMEQRFMTINMVCMLQEGAAHREEQTDFKLILVISSDFR